MANIKKNEQNGDRMESTYLEQLFQISRYWAAYETIAYNILMTVHTIGLFLFLPQNGYGQMGMTLFTIGLITLKAKAIISTVM